jgi:hypothetical protein
MEKTEQEDVEVNDVQNMIQVQAILETIPLREQKEDYHKIYNLVTKYITNHCLHCVVSDLIDVDVERSETIYYCNICFQTFKST